VLEESPPLAGIVVTYLWREFPESCRFTIREVNMKKKTQRTIAERDLPKPEFADVLRRSRKREALVWAIFQGWLKMEFSIVYAGVIHLACST
jgi:hypothetical protein